jgi:hypothetical protein
MSRYTQLGHGHAPNTSPKKPGAVRAPFIESLLAQNQHDASNEGVVYEPPGPNKIPPDPNDPFERKAGRIATKDETRPSTYWKRSKRKYYFRHGNHVDKLFKGECVWVERWECTVCKTPYALTGTTNVIVHLKLHGVYDPNDHQAGSGNSNPTGNGNVQNHVTIDTAMLKEATVVFFAVDHVPFLRMESPYFRRFCEVLNVDAPRVLPQSADTVRNWSIGVYGRKRIDLRVMFSNLVHPVNFTFDGWTADHSKLGLQGVVAHFVTNAGYRKTCLLGLPKVEGRHTGKNIADAIKKTLHEYGLDERARGCYVLDNASNNDTAVDILEGNNSGKRLRCSCHVLDLCSSAMFTPGSERHPAVQKIHVIAAYVLNSTWKDEYHAVFGKMIKMDNETRWGSVDTMIGSVIGKEMELNDFVRKMIQGTKDKSIKKKLEGAILSADDVVGLKEVKEILEPFLDATRRLEGISPVLLAMLMTR